jgi:DNA (cytosine-5)-methyltransferase 1
MISFGSVCSGIEAASVAWGPLGWKAAWLSEIEKFPCAVLAHHYPDVPNLGDMTTLPDRIRSGEVTAPDVFCGGTPCQAFSVAGLRKSLDDARGNLSLTFCEIADAIDQVRLIQQSNPSIVFWENVPGVLNTKDNAFGCFLGALAGEDDALIPPGGRWTNAGFIDGPQRAVAWRVLDAQYFGVAQRRRRVFVVASARDDFDPAAVLFEFEGLRRDTAPSRETGERIAPCVTNGPPFSRTGNERVEAEAMIVWPAEISSTLDTTFGTKQGLENQHVNAGCPMFVPAYAIQGNMIGRNDSAGPQGDGINEEVCFTQNTTDRHAVAQPIAYAFDSLSSNSMKSTNPISGCNEVNVCKTLDTSRGLDPSCNQGGVGIAQSMAVRRLTPVECERLQGFPDNYTKIADKTPDGPRYKALGNSWAVPVVRWIGERIARAT